MEFLIVDESKCKCKKDSICVAACTSNLIKLQEETGYPGIIPGGDNICNRCGHCVAVCPYGALILSEIPSEDCPLIKPELIINEEQAVQFLRSRRSIRAYKDKPVEREKIRRLIEIARYAPTGGNSQLVEWLVVTDKRKIHESARHTIEFFRRSIKENPRVLELSPYLSLFIEAWDAGYDLILWNAPVLVVASAPKEGPTGIADVCIALSYLSLVAPTMGLGTCWAGLLQGAIISTPPLRELLGIPAEPPHLFPMILGYPKARYYRLPGRKPPKITFG